MLTELTGPADVGKQSFRSLTAPSDGGREAPERRLFLMAKPISVFSLLFRCLSLPEEHIVPFSEGAGGGEPRLL